MLKYYIDNANDEDLKEKLENDYPQIYSAMCEENYEMEYPTYGFISEIKHEDGQDAFSLQPSADRILFIYNSRRQAF